MASAISPSLIRTQILAQPALGSAAENREIRQNPVVKLAAKTKAYNRIPIGIVTHCVVCAPPDLRHAPPERQKLK